MKYLFLLLIGFILPNWLFAQSAPLLSDIYRLDSLAFGSCNKQNQPQPMWDGINAYRPQIWIWLGDNIYGDSPQPDILWRKYQVQNQVPGYQKLKAKSAILGTWDDHDYGMNDGGKHFSIKAQSRDLLFEFLEVPANNPAWSRDGAYQYYDIGEGEQIVRIILLDTRYFRDDIQRDPETKHYLPNKEGELLGEDQWEWLTEVLTHSPAQYHLIANGTQVIPEEHGFEKWANFPNERIRFFDLLDSLKVKRPILLSGDRHLSELSTIDWKSARIFEVTSSGLTHSYSSVGDEPNRHRVGSLVSDKSFATLKFNWEEESTEVAFRNEEGEVIWCTIIYL